jgi:uncharacterized RDD family membrane protein YckC
MEEIGYATFPRRMYALIIDVLVLTVALIVVSFLMTLGIPDGWVPVLMGTFVVSLLLYDPILVSLRGGTIGHFRMNMRVVRQQTGGRVDFFRALIRTWLKMFTGLISFFFMPLSRRHQALHDIATGCAVVIHDLEKAESHHFRFEREEGEVTSPVSKMRRVAIIMIYWVVGFMAVSFASLLFVSSACLQSNVCSDGENLFYSIFGIVVVIGMGCVMVLGWKGMLPGARGSKAE